MGDRSGYIRAAHIRVGETVFVSIDGHGGSGKSTLAGISSTRLGASVVHIDDFAGLESPAGWWNGVIKAVFEPVAAGAGDVTFTPASWGPGHHPGPISIPVTPIMVLEGVSSSRSEFDAYIGFRFFVDTPMDVCLARGIERDMVLGKNREDVVHMWREWLDEEIEFMERDDPRSKADCIVDGTRSFGAQIDELERATRR